MSVAERFASTSSSSSVLEFICLYTHDLRRKQKRWEDGRLKFHSFNKRVMVYDDRGGQVGDMHWRRDYDFGEGEELELERGGVIVQVQDLVHRTEQDLSGLIDKRAKEKEQRQLQAVARARGPTSVLPQSMPQATPRPVSLDHFQLRHRPLHQLVGTPTGQHGRAIVPQESPYESRQQNADSPNDRAAKRRKYEDERPAKKGHAQALFGQTLTLSATPLSSMPARYRSRQEPSSSISVDDKTRDSGPQLENALREQPKSSLSFNHRKGDATSRLKAPKKTSSGCTTDQSHNLARDPRLKRATIPAGAEIIDMEDQDPASSSNPPTTMLEHAGKSTVETAAKADTRSKPSLPKQALARNVLFQSFPTTAEKKKKQAHRIEDARQSMKLNSSVTGTVEFEAPARGTSETPGSHDTARKSDRPMTELRLKSAKRRGLLMMSDRPKGPVRPLISGITSAASTTCEGVDQVAVADRAQPTPPLNSDGQDKVSINGEHFTAFKTSFELGKNEDPFRSPSPRPQERSRHGNSRPDLEDNERAEGVQLLHQEEDLDGHFEASSLMETEESIVRPSEVLEQTKASVSSPQGHVYDPYRLPSPSPGKESQAAPEQVFVSPRKAGMITGDNSLPADTHVHDEETGHSGDQNTAGTRRNRKMRRNIVLDDDEESETLFEVTEGVESIGGNDSDSNQDDVPPNRAKSPANIARRRKRKSSLENEGPELEVEEDLPTKRRLPSRKTRRRRVVSESPPRSSEDEPEREQPVKNRTKKATQVFEGGPRLTKLKKSVKSRELVGFDLSALKVPLSPRGIGVPFSILSSPADATKQRIVSQDATKPEQHLQTEIDDDGLQMQSDASKARAPIRETSEVCGSNLGSTNVDESLSDQAKPTAEKFAEPRCTTESHSPEQNVESLANSGSFEKQDVAPEKRPSKENVDTYQLQDARVAGTLSGDCPEKDTSSLVDVSMDMPCQTGAPGLATESSSVMQASNSCENRSLRKQPPVQAPKCEPSIIESEINVCAKTDVLSISKTTKISGPAAAVSRAPAWDGCDQPEVEKVRPTAAGGPQPRRTVGLRWTASAVRSINNLQIETTPPAEPPVGTTAAEGSTKPIARIANPATRGRKAALKSHAAGQAPQRILPPTQPPLFIPISTADLAMTPIEEPKKEPERPKKKMQFPGFQSARGEGPWSREAFDLLESGRPA